MPKTWSNSAYEHIDIDRNRKRGLPFAGWVIFGVGGLILCFIVIVCVAAILNPAKTNQNDAANLKMPTGLAAIHGQ